MPSNIHGIYDYKRVATDRNSLPPAGSSGGPGANKSSIWTGGENISMMRPDPSSGGGICASWFPYAGWKYFTTFITIVEIIMFIITLVVGSVDYDGAFVKTNSMLGPSTTTLYHMGGKWAPDIADGAIYRLFTSVILHAGVIHIAFNMAFQCRFGFVLERRWTWPRLALIYVLAGLGGSLLSCIGDEFVVSVGASGALFGLLGAEMTYVLYNWDTIPDKGTEMMMIVFVLLLNVIMSLGDSTIDNYGHLGGLVVGAFLGVAIPEHPKESPQETYWRAGGMFLGLAVLLAMFVVVMA